MTEHRIIQGDVLAGLATLPDGIIQCTVSSPPAPKFNSTDLLLLAHDEWKRREERKHNHPEGPWVAGFLSGFCTDKKWARDYINRLREEP